MKVKLIIVPTTFPPHIDQNKVLRVKSTIRTLKTGIQFASSHVLLLERTMTFTFISSQYHLLGTWPENDGPHYIFNYKTRHMFNRYSKVDPMVSPVLLSRA